MSLVRNAMTVPVVPVCEASAGRVDVARSRWSVRWTDLMGSGHDLKTLTGPPLGTGGSPASGYTPLIAEVPEQLSAQGKQLFLRQQYPSRRKTLPK